MTTRDRNWPMMMLAVAMLMPGGAHAGDDHVELARRLLAQGRILPLEQLLTQALSVRPGIPVEVELHAEDDPHRYVYEIEMLDRAGTVWSIAFDAKTGQLIDLDADED
ncbi:PepSY domain-containing protein [Lamprobacter modestohalophilus]|nr:PepSY domain-containing protein [Lamprobacter modestohalophilus]MCF7994599.1 PepSY domain-containing protein [Chromatiaceae bacterium]MCF8014838.1 PepSY domain-containing protein [Chromatiaceae bacterium]